MRTRCTLSPAFHYRTYVPLAFTFSETAQDSAFQPRVLCESDALLSPYSNGKVLLGALRHWRLRVSSPTLFPSQVLRRYTNFGRGLKQLYRWSRIRARLRGRRSVFHVLGRRICLTMSVTESSSSEHILSNPLATPQGSAVLRRRASIVPAARQSCKVCSSGVRSFGGAVWTKPGSERTRCRSDCFVLTPEGKCFCHRLPQTLFSSGGCWETPEWRPAADRNWSTHPKLLFS